MNWPLVVALGLLCLVLFLVERTGIRTTLQLSFRGDIRREAAFLAQYAQSACTPLVFILVWQLDDRTRALVLLAIVAGTAVIGMILKRLLGRVRPNREHSGRFLGPTFKHANHRESFPSNHSATAVALSVVLSQYYPNAAITFWALAVITALLRCMQDAHWPSDIVAGVLMGYVLAHYSLNAFGMS